MVAKDTSTTLEQEARTEVPALMRGTKRSNQGAPPPHLNDLLRGQATSACLVLGNGINRYSAAEGASSWDALLLELWQTHAFPKATRLPSGLSMTELYDALELRCPSPAPDLQKEFCRLMKDWEPRAQHRGLMTLAQELALPVLTTNFEDTLARAAGAPLRHLEPQGFTDFYPWASCFAPTPLERPESGFGIWHINGMSRYARSWLLIERARLFRKFPLLARRGTYAHVDPLSEGQRLFLETTGIEPMEFSGFDSLYGPEPGPG